MCLSFRKSIIYTKIVELLHKVQANEEKKQVPKDPLNEPKS